MRVDVKAAARANMRARTGDEEGAVARRLVVTPEERQAAREKQDALNVISSTCINCCKRIFPSETGDGLECAVLKSAELNGMALSPAEAKLAKGCTVPELYGQVFRGDKAPADVTRVECIARCPFEMPAGLVELALHEASDTLSPEKLRELHVAMGGNPKDAPPPAAPTAAELAALPPAAPAAA